MFQECVHDCSVTLLHAGFCSGGSDEPFLPLIMSDHEFSCVNTTTQIFAQANYK